jgi:2'-5' RNA ligase
MPENQTYALWIIPGDEEVYAQTSGFIARLSSLYDLPRFEPHITVLGGIPSPEPAELRKLAGSLDPFQVRLARVVEYMDEYFRFLFIRAYKTDGLMETFSKASALFGREADFYMPHMSLAYGDLPVWRKHEMIEELGPLPQIEFEAQAISLAQASTEMDVSSWKVVAHFPFAKVL